MGTRKSSQQHNFAQVPAADIERSSFDRSHGVKTTFNAGILTPIFVDEVLPGDTMNMKAEIFARITTLIQPIMDNVYLDVFFFFVPNRLLWENWERFNGAQDDPTDSTDFLVPQITPAAPGFALAGLEDHMGIPPLIPGQEISALWHRAYNKIWNEWFRDENLQDSVTENIDDGPDAVADYALLRRGKRHDYFTSCLPFPQKADAVDIPLGTSAPVVSAGDGIPSWDGSVAGTSSLFGNLSTNALYTNAAMDGTASWDDPKLEVDLTSATAATINSLREAFQIQRLYERDARGGTRYTELLKAHFGVTSPDARLQRSEYLGGGTIPILVKPVENNTSVTQAKLAGYGVANAGGIGFTKSFVEHGVLIGLVAARADLNYQQGIDRMWSRQTRFDFYWPALARLGEQAVLNKELDSQGTAGGARDDQVFGYQERYAEYRYKPNMITAVLRSKHPNTLDVWHLAQEFVDPVLNSDFIEEDPPIDRVVAFVLEPNFILDGFFRYHCARPMPTYSVPGMIDHF